MAGCSAVLHAAASLVAPPLQQQRKGRGGGLSSVEVDFDGPARQRAVRAIAFALDTAVRANETAAGAGVVTPFDCRDGVRPAVTIGAYCARFARYVPAPAAVFATALVYVDRACAQSRSLLVLRDTNAHRLFATAFVVASKFACDHFYTNKFYAKVAGVGLAELNSLERIFLASIGFGLFVDDVFFAHLEESILAVADAAIAFRGDVDAAVTAAAEAAENSSVVQQSPAGSAAMSEITASSSSSSWSTTTTATTTVTTTAAEAAAASDGHDAQPPSSSSS